MPTSFARRALFLPALITSLVLVPTQARAAVTLGNWDSAQQRQVVKDGLMTAPGGSFAGAAALSAAQADTAMVALAARVGSQSGSSAGAQPVHAVQIGAGAVTVVRFDALVVDQLGLADVSSHVQAVAASAGLAPPAYFGTEVVARYLGLRYDHPAGTDQLELFPTDPITRAEAAWSSCSWGRAICCSSARRASMPPPPSRT